VLTWVVARAAGFTAYALLTASVLLGLALGMRWRSPRWPRFATTELHRFVTLLTLVFLGLHVLTIALDGYMRFSLVEVLVPLASQYRPLWMGLGVVAAWLAATVWASTWLQRLIGYRTWRRLHYATFAVYAAATVHGFAAGSDRGAPWALAVYAASVAAVVGLTAARLAAPGSPSAGRAGRPGGGVASGDGIRSTAEGAP
jgi:predicted ferric reductase